MEELVMRSAFYGTRTRTKLRIVAEGNQRRVYVCMPLNKIFSTNFSSS